MTWLPLAVPLALLAQLALGLWVARRVRAADDFLLAGRRLGPGLLLGTVFATWFGAETCIGSAGTTFDAGFSWSHPEPFAYGLCLLLAGCLLAAPLWRRGLFTLADLFRRRFSPGVERLAALAMLPTSLLWAAAQVRALGHLVQATTGWPELHGVLLAALCGTLYTAAGGLLAVAVTDVFQGGLVVLGLLALCVAAAQTLGPEGLSSDLWAAPGPDSATPLGLLEAWCVPILGSLVAQELVVRQSAARSARVARWGTIAAGLLYLAVGVMPVFLALCARRLGLPASAGEGVLPLLALELLPGLGAALFVASLSAAMLSTIDSSLLVAASLGVQNLATPGDQRPLHRLRAAVLLLGAFAALLALSGSGVARLVELASSLGSSGLLVITLFGLWSPWGRAPCAAAALLVGLFGYPLGAAAGLSAPFLASLLASLLAYLVCIPFGRRAAGRAGPPPGARQANPLT
jgi:Na+/proline symporter